ncbi:MAG: YigZ family protein [Acholeplasmataceae bacterium]
MYYLKKQTISEIIISKSRFIGVITPINNLDEMNQILKQLKKDFPKATHYCTAYIFNQSQGSNDDGEPSGTAGVPILEILNHHKLNKVFAVVIRYYGGINLGAGGLIRAYAKSTKDSLENAHFLKEVTLDSYTITFNYDKVNEIDLIFHNFISDKEYTDIITYHLLLSKDSNLIQTNNHLLINYKYNGEKTVYTPKKNHD